MSVIIGIQDPRHLPQYYMTPLVLPFTNYQADSTVEQPMQPISAQKHHGQSDSQICSPRVSNCEVESSRTAFDRLGALRTTFPAWSCSRGSGLNALLQASQTPLEPLYHRRRFARTHLGQ
jgi:hypothetical protein